MGCPDASPLLLVSDEISQVSATCDTASSAEPMEGLLHNLACGSSFLSNSFPNKATEHGTTRLAEGRLVPRRLPDACFVGARGVLVQ